MASTLIPFIRSDAGFIRTFDFPRLQVAVASVPILILLLIFARDRTGLALFAALLACFAYQAYRIFPFTPLHAPQAVAATAATCRQEAEVSLLVANVLQDNTDHQSLLRLVDRHDPDLLLVLETDARWRDALISLRARYPSVIEQPQPNTYGLLFYAKLPLENPQVRFLLQDDVPSIRTVVVLPSGERFTLFGVHPRPPHPGHSSAPRDAELVMVAREVRDLDGPAVVAGDLNDVAWSRTTTLFQKISGLLDPRIGRGLYPTFNAKWPLLRWPLDHIFFSDDFLLGRLERLPYIGSDHFPILISLCRTAVAPRVQDAPEATASDMEAGREAIEAVK
ncbi:endonuclease/exonuclease/phosphatase family protein [Methylobacterium sp. Leaf112]|uniref:endonuclease/exonuclease/phosphatase family protein n=1 Tax=Methylobacterium sp. Leaf112 TaxID=1736258 RepID=UPI001FCE207C|nr:endonuclease/exonuclease/phosphatase family protein [Methylobacterium sp. Leaf112]